MHFNHPSDRDSLSDAIDELKELFVSTIADLGTAVAANTQAVTDLQAHLAAAGTTLDAADQATVDGIVTGLEANTAALQAIVTPPVAVPPPVG
jgi:CheY-specific phosphatase CheX